MREECEYALNNGPSLHGRKRQRRSELDPFAPPALGAAASTGGPQSPQPQREKQYKQYRAPQKPREPKVGAQPQRPSTQRGSAARASTYWLQEDGPDDLLLPLPSYFPQQPRSGKGGSGGRKGGGGLRPHIYAQPAPLEPDELGLDALLQQTGRRLRTGPAAAQPAPPEPEAPSEQAAEPEAAAEQGQPSEADGTPAASLAVSDDEGEESAPAPAFYVRELRSRIVVGEGVASAGRKAKQPEHRKVAKADKAAAGAGEGPAGDARKPAAAVAEGGGRQLRSGRVMGAPPAAPAAPAVLLPAESKRQTRAAAAAAAAEAAAAEAAAKASEPPGRALRSGRAAATPPDPSAGVAKAKAAAEPSQQVGGSSRELRSATAAKESAAKATAAAGATGRVLRSSAAGKGAAAKETQTAKQGGKEDSSVAAAGDKGSRPRKAAMPSLPATTAARGPAGPGKLRAAMPAIPTPTAPAKLLPHTRSGRAVVRPKREEIFAVGHEVGGKRAAQAEAETDEEGELSGEEEEDGLAEAPAALLRHAGED